MKKPQHNDMHTDMTFIVRLTHPSRALPGVAMQSTSEHKSLHITSRYNIGRHKDTKSLRSEELPLFLLEESEPWRCH